MKPNKPREPWYDFTAQADESSAEIHIFGPIGGGFFADEDAPSGKRIAEELDALSDSVKTIRVLVNSPGGNVFDAIHIANALRRQREEKGRTVEIDIEAIAASAATIITSAGDPIRMPENALYMIHNPSAIGMGDARLMRELAGVLEKVRNSIIATYRWVTNLSAKKLGEMMDAETWMEASEALENGFITEVKEPISVAATLTAETLDELRIPAEYRDRIVAMVRPETGKTKIIASAPLPAPALDEGKMKPKADQDPQEQTGQDAKAIAEAQAQARKEERARVQAIQITSKTAITAGLEKKDVDELEKSAIDNGHTVDQHREAIFDKLATKSDTTGPTPVPGISPIGGEDERDKRRRGIVAALWHRAGVADVVRQAAKKKPDHPAFQNLEYDPAEFRGMSLLEHVKEDLERSRRGSSRGRTSMQVASDFFAHAAGVGQGTSDFAVAFEEALNKTLLAAYTITPDTWRRFCKVGSVNDFRGHNRYRRGFLSRLDRVPESGSFENKNVPDAEKEVQQIFTFGNILALSRQAIVNDDMSIFEDLAATLGRAAALSIDLEVYDTLKLNSGLGPTMQDGNTLFHASHNNIGTGSALTIAGIEADSILMAQQTDPSGNEVLDMKPEILVVPIGLRGTGLQINNAEFEDFNRGKPNRVLGLFGDVVGTARLTGTRRYLFTDPAIAAVLEVAFLEGEQEPFMEMQDGWRVDGVEWKVRHDFGVAAIDFRGAVTNAGV